MGLLSVFLLSASLAPRDVVTCMITTISWHVNTPDGLIVGQTEFWHCDNGTGGSGGETGEGPGGDPYIGPPPDPTVPCVDPNANHIVTDLRLVIAFTSLLPFGPDPLRENGTHQGVDLFAANGTEIRSPCDGVIGAYREDIPRDLNRDNSYPGQPGNYLEIRVTDGSDDDGTAILGTVYSAHLDHLDENFLSRTGLKPGDRVRRGQLIGYSDNTGQIQGLGPHLHLGFKRITAAGGENIDPQYLVDCGRNE